MEYRQLGRTGIGVSLLGLGTGGANRFGQDRGAGEAAAGALVRAALDRGVNFFDTAQVYGASEELLAAALVGVPRSEYVIASKYTYRDPSGALLEPAALDAVIRDRLRRLRVDVLDVLQVHGLKVADYDVIVERHLPVLEQAKAAGLIRAIGVTESFAGDDPLHVALLRALREPRFETVMVGYNVLHQNAEAEVLPLAEANRVGVFVMAAVRRSLRSRPELEAQIAELKAAGLIPRDSLPVEDPLGWLVDGGASSVQAAAYRYTAESAAVSSVLTGTFDAGHLAENADALAAGPLPPADRDRLRAVFGHLELGLGR